MSEVHTNAMVRWHVCLSTHWEGYWRRIKWYSQHVMWHHCHQLAHRPNNCWFLSVSRSSGTLCDPLLVKFFIHLALCCVSINLWLYQPMLFSPLYFCISFSYSLAKYHCHQDQEILSSWLMAQSTLPPITVSNSVKNQIKCIGVLFIWFAFSSTFS